MPGRFYVYVHRKQTDGSVFYVGKGSGTRASSRHGRSLKWRAIANKNGWTHHIIANFSKEECAFSFEVAIIKSIGRDSLANLTDGGDGVSGYDMTDEQKKHASEVTKSYWQNPEYRERIEGIFGSDSFRKKKSAALKKSQKRPEVIEKLSASAKKMWGEDALRKKMCLSMSRARGGKPFSNSAGVRFDTHSEAVRWLKENGWPKASQGNLAAALSGSRSKAYGYEWQYECETTIS